MDLGGNEREIYSGHPSALSILGFYMKGLVVAVIAGAIAAGVSQLAKDGVKTGWIVVAAGVVIVVTLVAGLLKRIATTYTITTRRLHVRRGILSRREEETRIDRMTNVTTSQSFLERMLRIGTVNFDTASNEPTDLFKFRGVADPQGIVRAVDEAQGGVDQVADDEAPADPPPAAPR
jgi:uncharacterized membrane protein YdbT with pleckstrin-like domain